MISVDLGTNMATTLTPNQLDFIGKTPWSAAFISYTVQASGTSFPLASAHTVYAQKIRTGFSGWSALNPRNTRLQLGDIVVQNRNNNTLKFETNLWSGDSHGDIVTALGSDVASAVGGNLSDSVVVTRHATSNNILTSNNFFVVLRPPKTSITRIVTAANTELQKWKSNSWKESTPAAADTLSAYYKAVGLNIPPQVTAALPGPAVMIDATGYIDQVYKQPFRDVKPSQAGVVNREAANAGTFSQEYQNFLKSLQVDSQSTDKQRNGLLILDDTIKGDLQLIAGLASAQVASEAKVNHIAGTILSTYSLTAKQDLVTSQIFELAPDRMRIKMAQTADTPNGTSHAWRAPGKLSITADITIPGMSGLRIAQMFWIDRIAENYKKFGAFQIFGITEHIDIGKGWTTSLHSRFNALPHKLLANKQLYDDDESSDPTMTNPTQATPTTP